MPTPIPAPEKAAFIALVRAAPYPGGILEANRLEDILNNYEDIPTAIGRQQRLFAGNNAYLRACMDVFPQNELTNVGIWYGFTQLSPYITDPVIIINSTLDLVQLTNASPPYYKALVVMGNSTIKEVLCDSGITLNEMWVMGGSTVEVLNATDSSPAVITLVNQLWVTTDRDAVAQVNSASAESVINNVYVEAGSYYGGIKEDPEATCADVVTNLQASEITQNSLLLSWDLPAQYLFVFVKFKRSNTPTWKDAEPEDGIFTPDNKFLFTHLEKDTYYDFRVTTVCQNGKTAKADLSVRTYCCGDVSTVAPYKVCPITMIITSEPDSPPSGQVLCNGASINLHYPPGATIQIPYLANLGATILQPFVIDNSNVQQVPFDSTTGTFDFSGTSIGAVIEGNVCTVNVTLPI